MKVLVHRFKPIVASLAAAVGFSILLAPPAGAEVQSQRATELLEALREAPPGADERIVEALRDEWAKSGSPTLDLLFQRGIDALHSGDYLLATEHLTAAIDHHPGYAEAYAARARSYYLMGDIGPAIDDLRQALTLNPAQFEAMFGFAVILEELGKPQEALEVYRMVLEIYPADTIAAASVERLEQSLQGEAI